MDTQNQLPSTHPFTFAPLTREDSILPFGISAQQLIAEYVSNNPHFGTSAVLERAYLAWADSTNDINRQTLKPLASFAASVGPDDKAKDAARSWLAIDWFYRRFLAQWVGVLGWTDLRRSVLNLPTINSIETLRGAEELGAQAHDSIVAMCKTLNLNDDLIEDIAWRVSPSLLVAMPWAAIGGYPNETATESPSIDGSLLEDLSYRGLMDSISWMAAQLEAQVLAIVEWRSPDQFIEARTRLEGSLYSLFKGMEHA